MGEGREMQNIAAQSTQQTSNDLKTSISVISESKKGHLPINFKVHGDGVITVEHTEKKSSLVKVFSKWKNQVDDKAQTEHVTTSGLLELKKFANEKVAKARNNFTPPDASWADKMANYIFSPKKAIGLVRAENHSKALIDSINKEILERCKRQQSDNKNEPEMAVSEIYSKIPQEIKSDRIKYTQMIHNQTELLAHLQETANADNPPENITEIIDFQKSILTKMLEKFHSSESSENEVAKIYDEIPGHIEGDHEKSSYMVRKQLNLVMNLQEVTKLDNPPSTINEIITHQKDILTEMLRQCDTIPTLVTLPHEQIGLSESQKREKAIKELLLLQLWPNDKQDKETAEQLKEIAQGVFKQAIDYARIGVPKGKAEMDFASDALEFFKDQYSQRAKRDFIRDICLDGIRSYLETIQTEPKEENLISLALLSDKSWFDNLAYVLQSRISDKINQIKKYEISYLLELDKDLHFGDSQLREDYIYEITQRKELIDKALINLNNILSKQ